jgi:competence protein ComEC
MLAHFNQLSIIGVIANLAVVPLAAVATVAGLLAVVVALGSEVAGHALFDGVWLVLLALRACVHAAASVPGAMLHLPAPPWPAMATFYAGLTIAASSARRAEGEPSQKHPKMTDREKRNPESRGEASRATESEKERSGAGQVRRRRWPAAVAAFLMLAGVGIGLWPVLRPADGMLRATFLDVGQGDAIVIELPDGRTLLVDAGPGGAGRIDAGARVVAPFLWNRGVRRIAAMVPTHDDADHAGGAPSIMKLFSVEQIWSAGSVVTPEGAGLVRRWFGDVAVTVLSPPAEGLPLPGRGAAADRNNGSIVLRVDFGLASLLLTGDIETEAEDYLRGSQAPIRALVLKLAHHGAARSTGHGFLDAVRPEFAVISAGAGNRFGHPAPETLERLRRSGARIYRTDEQGAVEIETDGATLTITTWADRRREQFDLSPPLANP